MMYNRPKKASIKQSTTMQLAGEKVIFRPFQPDSADVDQMGELAFDNAFLGKPFDEICRCKSWFADVVINPYVQHQPGNIHVAVLEESGRLVGYLTGSTGGEGFEVAQYRMVRNKLMSLAASVAMPWNFFDHASRLFATHILLNGEKERPDHPHEGVHWHFQVARDYRGQGIGTHLLQRFKKDAINAKFELIWAEVMAYELKSRKYFEAHGWDIYDERPTAIFRDRVDFPVNVICITKSLTEV